MALAKYSARKIHSQPFQAAHFLSLKKYITTQRAVLIAMATQPAIAPMRK